MMHFANLHAFFMMGGYASYIWPAYGITLLVLILNAFLPWWRGKHARRT